MNTEPVIGETYLVDTIENFPVMGNPHIDPEFGVFEKHWHVDIRFMSEQDLRINGWLQNICQNRYDQRVFVPTIRCLPNQAVITQPLVCYRKGFSLAAKIWKDGAQLVIDFTGTKALEQKFLNKKMNLNCMRCPHQNINLKNQKNNGETVVCPGHGLQWSLKSGKLIPKDVSLIFEECEE